MAASLNGLGLIARARNDYPEARALHEESLAILRELGDTWGIVAKMDGDSTSPTRWVRGIVTSQRPN